MQAKEQHTAAISRMANTPDARYFNEFLSDLILHYADIRNIPQLTTEKLESRKLACEIIQTEILDRFKKRETEHQIITEEYD